MIIKKGKVIFKCKDVLLRGTRNFFDGHLRFREIIISFPLVPAHDTQISGILAL